MPDMTTIKLPAPLRDRVAALAAEYGGVSMAEVIKRLVEEHENSQIVAAFEELRRDPAAWAAEQRESAITDSMASDWMHSEAQE